MKLPPFASRVRRTRATRASLRAATSDAAAASFAATSSSAFACAFLLGREFTTGADAETAKPPSAADHRPLPRLLTTRSKPPMETSLAGGAAKGAVASPSALNPGGAANELAGRVGPAGKLGKCSSSDASDGADPDQPDRALLGALLP